MDQHLASMGTRKSEMKLLSQKQNETKIIRTLQAKDKNKWTIFTMEKKQGFVLDSVLG